MFPVLSSVGKHAHRHIMTTNIIHQLIGAEWQMYVSVIYVITGSDNSLSLDRRQAIIWTSADLLPNSLRNTPEVIFNQFINVSHFGLASVW